MKLVTKNAQQELANVCLFYSLKEMPAEMFINVCQRTACQFSKIQHRADKSDTETTT